MKEATVPAADFLWFVARYAILKRSARTLRKLSKSLERKAAALLASPYKRAS